jgi:predicted acylesterase/phospholipase RssA
MVWLEDFKDTEELKAAIKATCKIPILAGAPTRWRGRRLVDGGLLHLLPALPAHDRSDRRVLAVSCFPLGHKPEAVPLWVQALVRRDGKALPRVLHHMKARNMASEGWAETSPHCHLVTNPVDIHRDCQEIALLLQTARAGFDAACQLLQRTHPYPRLWGKAVA